MLYSRSRLVHFGSLTILWMILNTYITHSFGFALVIAALIIGAVQYLRIPPLHESKISECILSLFRIDGNNYKKNTIFHKGGGFHAPENTLEAVQEAIRLGIPAVEIDLEFSKDGVGVLIHGPTVDDTTDGSGLVSEFTFEQLQSLNAAAKDINKSKYPTVRIPTLEECVQLCMDNDIVMFIDCKSKPSQTAKLIASLYQKYPKLYGLGVVCSFYPTIIYAVRQADMNILTGLTHRNFVLTTLGQDKERNTELWKRVVAPVLDAILSWAHWSFLWYICGNSFVLWSKDKICRDDKKFWKSLGIRLVSWTVNDNVEKDYFLESLHVPIITDGLDKPTSL